jgi:hypothetical protein
LVIVDASLEGTSPVALVQAIRQAKPMTRVMWMPFLGEPLGEEMYAIDAQGVLTKPFFIEELPQKIQSALSRQPGVAWPPEDVEQAPDVSPAVAETPAIEGIARPAVQPAAADKPARKITLAPAEPLMRRVAAAKPPEQTSAPPADPAGGHEPAAPRRITLAPFASASSRRPEAEPAPVDEGDPLRARLQSLAQALSAESAVVVDRDGKLLAWAGFGGQRKAVELAALVGAELAPADRLAAFLGERNGRFLNSVHEGKDFRLFSECASESGWVLSVALRCDIPLGTVRYQVKQAAAELAGRGNSYGSRE